VAVDYTTTGLLEALRGRGMLPDNVGAALDDDELISLLTDELHTTIVELLLDTNEEYLVTHEDIAIEVGTAEYDIPKRAVGGIVRNVSVLSGDDYVPLDRIEPEYETDTLINGFKFEGDRIVLIPSPTTAGTLRVSYYRRPNALVPTTSARQITDIDAENNTITVATGASGFTGSAEFDLISNTKNFRSKADSIVPIASVGDTEFTFSSLPDDLAVGDWLCLAEESPLPQMPVELRKLLVAKAAARALEEIGDVKAEAVEQKADKARVKSLSLLTPRGRGKGRVIINRNGPGWGGARRRFRS
jgi:hypothetical protein